MDQESITQNPAAVTSAKHLLALRHADLPALATETAVEAVADTFGVMLAGASEPGVLALARALSGSIADGPAWCVATPGRIDVLNASLLNGMAAHALDFDDCSNTMGGHPSAPILPVLLALADREASKGGEVTGDAFVRAYLAGFECEARLGQAVNFEHYEKGWHPTATLGTFGAAAAAASLLELDLDQTAAALAIASSMAAGIKANFGSDVKPFHVGQSARNGLLAALMAKQGITANPLALEHPQGFFNVYNSAEGEELAKLQTAWDGPLDIVRAGVAYKQHPCCASTHPAIDAALQLCRQHDITADDIVSLRSFTHPRRLRHTNRPDPQTGLEGKFSVQYCLARAVTDGVVSPSVFTDVAVQEPAVRDVMARIHAAPHPDADMNSTEHFFAEVEIDLRNGRRVSAWIDRPLGRDRDHPLPEGALHRKFLSCVAPVLGDAAAADLASRLQGLAAAKDAASVFHHPVRA